ncbi:MAG: S8 family serine peptidase [Pseudomonadota bacterium]
MLKHLKRFKLNAIASSVILASTSSAAWSTTPPLALQTLEEIAAKRIIVSWDSSQATMDDLMGMMSSATETMGVNVKYERPSAINDVHILTVETDQVSDVPAVMSLMSDHQAMQWMERDFVVKANFQPDDENYPMQWHYFDPVSGINAEPAWDITTGADTVVAVVDTGILPHIDIVNNLLVDADGNRVGADLISLAQVAVDGDGRDQDPTDAGDFYAANECGDGIPAAPSSWHGLHVAGTVAATTNNAIGVAGVAFDSRVVPVRVLGKCGGLNSDVNDGIVWASGGAVQGVNNISEKADVINLSLGGGGACGPNSMAQLAVNTARANGSVVVVASGNSNMDVANFTPGSCDGVISVAAVGRQGARAGYSNFGNLIDVAAPGGDQNANNNLADGVLSVMNSGLQAADTDNLTFYQGTSMAAPHVAGIAALVRSIRPEASPDIVETIIKEAVRPFPVQCNGCGTGIVDSHKAVLAAANIEALPSAEINTEEDTPLNIELTDLPAIVNGPFNANFELALSIKQLPEFGTLMINNAPATTEDVYAAQAIESFIYMPNANANGDDTFTFRYLLAGIEMDEDVLSQLKVAAVNDAPTISTPISNIQQTVGESIAIDLARNFTDLDNDVLSFSITGLPTGLQISTQGMLEGITSETGSHSLTIAASDGSETISTDFTLTIISNENASNNSGSEDSGAPSESSDSSDNNADSSDSSTTTSGNFGYLTFLLLSLFGIRRLRR